MFYLLVHFTYISANCWGSQLRSQLHSRELVGLIAISVPRCTRGSEKKTVGSSMTPETATLDPHPFGETLEGSFSALSTPIFATKYIQILILQHFWMIFRDLQDLHLFCTFLFRNGKTLENPPQGPAKCSCICGQGCRTKPGLQKNGICKTCDNEKKSGSAETMKE